MTEEPTDPPAVAAHVRTQRPEDGIALVTIDRPDRRNALSIAVRDELADALDALAADDDVRVVVLTGAGTTFSAGFDLDEFAVAAEDAGFAGRLWASSDRYHHTVLTFPLPLVAAVNGPAVAGGFDLAVLADIRVVADTAHFSHPEFSFGEVVYGPLRELVGGGPARELLLTGRRIEATEAKAIGLTSTVVPADDVVPAALGIARRTAAAPRHLLVAHKAKILRQAGVLAADGRPAPTLSL